MAKTASPTSDDEMMSVDTNQPVVSPVDPVGDMSRWEVANQHFAEQQAIADADSYILELVRIFTKAIQSMAMFKSEEVMEQLDLLPLEQQYSPTVMTLLGKAFFEMLEYPKVCTMRAHTLADFNLHCSKFRLKDVSPLLENTIPTATKTWTSIQHSCGTCQRPRISLSCLKNSSPWITTRPLHGSPLGTVTRYKRIIAKRWFVSDERHNWILDVFMRII